MSNRLQEMLYRFIDKYADVYKEVNSTQNYKNPFSSLIRNDICNQLKTLVDLDSSKYIIKGSVGAGRWTTVPWIAIFDKRITSSAQKGVYIVYLLNKDKKELYLTLNQGATNVSQEESSLDGKVTFTGISGSSNSKLLAKLKNNAQKIRATIKAVRYNIDSNINSGSPGYDAGAICYKKYTLENLPDDKGLLGDLKGFLQLYDTYVEGILSESTDDGWWPTKEDYDLQLTKENWIRYILEVELPHYPSPMRMLKGMMELGGEASCKQLSELYGGHPSVYAGCAMNLGRRVKKHFNLPPCMDGKQERYFPFPFLGKYRGGSEDNYIYRIRPELLAALNEIDLSSIDPHYQEEHKTGHFDSWEIVDENTAIKTCDKSFFAYNGSGVPKEICWFFGAENIPTGTNKVVKLIFNGQEYAGKLSNDTTDRRRIQIRWSGDLAKGLEEYQTNKAKAKFIKFEDGVYELLMCVSEEIFDEELFNKALTAYKSAINNGWLINELYKWEAIKSFQSNWNINEPNFVEMWEQSTKAADNLLGSRNTYPRKMIAEFAAQEPDAVRAMFVELYDETISFEERIDNFRKKSDDLIEKYGDEKKKQHFQSLNAITVYLWLRYPDKYYIYKFGELEKADKIGFDLSKDDKIGSAYKLYDRISEIFGKDPEIEAIRKKHLNAWCYPDKFFRTFAIDFIYYVSRGYLLEASKGSGAEMTIKEKVAKINEYISAKGFNYDGQLIENFYLSLKAKPFVILAGTSGTGKTRLVRLFAEAIQAQYKLVSVRPDWSDSSDLFGHVDLNQKFIPGAIIDFVKQAELNPTKPYFLCLDEMNLARVEYYMSDILSAIETRCYESGRIVTDPVIPSSNYGNDSSAAGRYGKVILPGNLYIVGTVNMDETTFPFSKKVLDRANTIEFSYVDLLSMPTFSTQSAEQISVQNDFLASKYITLNDCDAKDAEYISSVCTTLQRINSVLEKANAHVGYRVRDEIVFYMLNNRESGLLEETVAFDNQIMQKILPRIQGSSEAIKAMLEDLLKVCASEKYTASEKKIDFMIKRYEEDGFTSYWL